MIGKLMLTAIAGFGAHLTRPLALREFGNSGWLPIVLPTIGVLTTYPFFPVFWKALGGSDDEVPRLTAVFFLAFGSIGLGTLVGHFFVPDEKG